MSEKTKLLTVRIDPEQLADWKRKAEAVGVPLAELIRSAVDGAKIEAKPRARKAPPELVAQVAKIGNNLNQIARRCNTGERFDVLSELQRIEADLSHLLEPDK